MEQVLRDIRDLHTSLAVKEKPPVETLSDIKCTDTKFQPHAPVKARRLLFLLQRTMKRSSRAGSPRHGAPSAAIQHAAACPRSRHLAADEVGAPQRSREKQQLLEKRPK